VSGTRWIMRPRREVALQILAASAVVFFITQVLTLLSIALNLSHLERALPTALAWLPSYLVLLVLTIAASSYEGTQLRPDGILARRLWPRPTRFCPWDQITWISVGSVLGTRVVYVHGAFGRVRLAVPTRDWLPFETTFDAEVAAIFTWWEHHRSFYWSPPWGLPPPPGPAWPGRDPGGSPAVQPPAIRPEGEHGAGAQAAAAP
jgi:hypothetical protein